MNYEEFKEQLLFHVQNQFSEDTSVRIQEVQKNNGLILDALIINEPEVNISPTIYINPIFKDYEKEPTDKEFEIIVRDIVKTYYNHKNDLNLDIHIFDQFDEIKEHIVYRLINYEKNRELLSEVPHIPYLDLAIVFVCLFPSTDAGTGSVLIRNEHAAFWQVSTKELFRIAKKNTPKLLPYDLRNMGSWIKELFPSEMKDDTLQQLPLYVLTNDLKIHGACCILYKELLKQVAERFASDIVILPSSVHEVLLMPSYYSNTTDELNALVRQVNTDEVRDEEILSDHIYYYDRKTNTVSY